ncbi:MAG: TRAP transporter small permease [Chloroflexi bacterium]|nr:TRAP transporter small permease [Chloroflexota bacterium]
MKLSSRVGHIFDRSLDVLAVFSGVLLVLVLLFVNFDVFTRSVLGKSQVWVDQIAQHSMVWITFLGAAWLLRKEGHISLDLVLVRLKPDHQHVMNIVTSAVSAIICLALAWGSIQNTWFQYRMGYLTPTVWEIPMAPVTIIIPIGSLLLSIQFLRRAYREALKRGIVINARDLA